MNVRHTTLFNDSRPTFNGESAGSIQQHSNVGDLEILMLLYFCLPNFIIMFYLQLHCHCTTVILLLLLLPPCCKVRTNKRSFKMNRTNQSQCAWVPSAKIRSSNYGSPHCSDWHASGGYQTEWLQSILNVGLLQENFFALYWAGFKQFRIVKFSDVLWVFFSFYSADKLLGHRVKH